jgi:hypothetical protein
LYIVLDDVGFSGMEPWDTLAMDNAAGKDWISP